MSANYPNRGGQPSATTHTIGQDATLANSALIQEAVRSKSHLVIVQTDENGVIATLPISIVVLGPGEGEEEATSVLQFFHRT